LINRSDNGVVIYINGVEILRNNLPQGTLNSTTFALRPANPLKKNIYYSFPNLDKSIKSKTGDSIIGVIVFHSNESVPNISFDLDFTGIFSASIFESIFFLFLK